MAVTDTVILLLLFLLAYAWIGYPLVLAGMVRLCAGRRRRHSAQPETLPGTVSFLFSAHNEEEHIVARLANLQLAIEELRSSGMRCEILAGVDGSTDRTADFARSMAAEHAEIRVFENPERRGKIRMVKDLVAAASGDVLVLTDANTFFRPGSAVQLLKHFVNRDIGGVCGRLELREPGTRSPESGTRSPESGTRSPESGTRSPESGTRSPESGTRSPESGTRSPESGTRSPESGTRSPEGSYWDWENRLKLMESDLDSCLGANGAIYAIRRELFWRDVPDNTVVDDFVIGMKVREAGSRMVYEPAAVAEEDLPEHVHEWRRRVRIGAGDFQAIALCGRCLLPRYGFFAWAFWSHKVLRWLTPHFTIVVVLLAILHCSRFTVHGSPLTVHCSRFQPSVILLAGCLAGLVAWVVGRRMRSANPARRSLVSLFLLWEHFVTMQAALFAGSLHYLRGDLKGHWTRTPRRGA